MSFAGTMTPGTITTAGTGSPTTVTAKIPFDESPPASPPKLNATEARPSIMNFLRRNRVKSRDEEEEDPDEAEIKRLEKRVELLKKKRDLMLNIKKMERGIESGEVESIEDMSSNRPNESPRRWPSLKPRLISPRWRKRSNSYDDDLTYDESQSPLLQRFHSALDCIEDGCSPLMNEISDLDLVCMECNALGGGNSIYSKDTEAYKRSQKKNGANENRPVIERARSVDAIADPQDSNFAPVLMMARTMSHNLLGTEAPQNQVVEKPKSRAAFKSRSKSKETGQSGEKDNVDDARGDGWMDRAATSFRSLAANQEPDESGVKDNVDDIPGDDWMGRAATSFRSHSIFQPNDENDVGLDCFKMLSSEPETEAANERSSEMNAKFAKVTVTVQTLSGLSITCKKGGKDSDEGWEVPPVQVVLSVLKNEESVPFVHIPSLRIVKDPSRDANKKNPNKYHVMGVWDIAKEEGAAKSAVSFSRLVAMSAIEGEGKANANDNSEVKMSPSMLHLRVCLKREDSEELLPIGVAKAVVSGGPRDVELAIPLKADYYKSMDDLIKKLNTKPPQSKWDAVKTFVLEEEEEVLTCARFKGHKHEAYRLANDAFIRINLSVEPETQDQEADNGWTSSFLRSMSWGLEQPRDVSDANPTNDETSFFATNGAAFNSLFNTDPQPQPQPAIEDTKPTETSASANESNMKTFSPQIEHTMSDDTRRTENKTSPVSVTSIAASILGTEEPAKSQDAHPIEDTIPAITSSSADLPANDDTTQEKTSDGFADWSKSAEGEAVTEENGEVDKLANECEEEEVVETTPPKKTKKSWFKKTRKAETKLDDEAFIDLNRSVERGMNHALEENGDLAESLNEKEDDAAPKKSKKKFWFRKTKKADADAEMNYESLTDFDEPEEENGSNNNGKLLGAALVGAGAAGALAATGVGNNGTSCTEKPTFEGDEEDKALDASCTPEGADFGSDRPHDAISREYDGEANLDASGPIFARMGNDDVAAAGLEVEAMIEDRETYDPAALATQDAFEPPFNEQRGVPTMDTNSAKAPPDEQIADDCAAGLFMDEFFTAPSFGAADTHVNTEDEMAMTSDTHEGEVESFHRADEVAMASQTHENKVESFNPVSIDEDKGVDTDEPPEDLFMDDVFEAPSFEQRYAAATSFNCMDEVTKASPVSIEDGPAEDTACDERKTKKWFKKTKKAKSAKKTTESIPQVVEEEESHFEEDFAAPFIVEHEIETPCLEEEGHQTEEGAAISNDVCGNGMKKTEKDHSRRKRSGWFKKTLRTCEPQRAQVKTLGNIGVRTMPTKLLSQDTSEKIISDTEASQSSSSLGAKPEVDVEMVLDEKGTNDLNLPAAAPGKKSKRWILKTPLKLHKQKAVNSKDEDNVDVESKLADGNSEDDTSEATSPTKGLSSSSKMGSNSSFEVFNANAEGGFYPVVAESDAVEASCFCPADQIMETEIVNQVATGANCIRGDVSLASGEYQLTPEKEADDTVLEPNTVSDNIMEDKVSGMVSDGEDAVQEETSRWFDNMNDVDMAKGDATNETSYLFDNIADVEALGRGGSHEEEEDHYDLSECDCEECTRKNVDWSKQEEDECEGIELELKPKPEMWGTWASSDAISKSTNNTRKVSGLAGKLSRAKRNQNYAEF